MIQTTEEAERLEIATPMPLGMRLVFGLIALFPLLAPYELLLRPHWTTYLSLFFLFPAVISAGAIALSLLLGFAAVAGLSTRMTFDAARSTFTYSAVAPVFRRTQTFPLSSVESVAVRPHEWSEGEPTYSLVVKVAGGPIFDTGSAWSREEVERRRDRVEAFLARSGGPAADANRV